MLTPGSVELRLWCILRVCCATQHRIQHLNFCRVGQVVGGTGVNVSRSASMALGKRVFARF